MDVVLIIGLLVVLFSYVMTEASGFTISIAILYGAYLIANAIRDTKKK